MYLKKQTRKDIADLLFAYTEMLKVLKNKISDEAWEAGAAEKIINQSKEFISLLCPEKTERKKKMCEHQIKYRFGNTGTFKNPKDGARKNTMATVKHDDLLFFGIARCNFRTGDYFDKARGKEIATLRLNHAFFDGITEVGVNMANNEKTIVFSENGLYGVCHISMVKELVDYFYDIDMEMLRQRNEKWKK